MPAARCSAHVAVPTGRGDDCWNRRDVIRPHPTWSCGRRGDVERTDGGGPAARAARARGPERGVVCGGPGERAGSGLACPKTWQWRRAQRHLNVRIRTEHVASAAEVAAAAAAPPQPGGDAGNDSGDEDDEDDDGDAAETAADRFRGLARNGWRGPAPEEETISGNNSVACQGGRHVPGAGDHCRRRGARSQSVRRSGKPRLPAGAELRRPATTRHVGEKLQRRAPAHGRCARAGRVPGSWPAVSGRHLL